MRLVDIVLLHRLVFCELDQSLLVSLLGVLDARPDEHGNGTVRLLLEMRDKLGLEDAGDDGVAFFACSRIDGLEQIRTGSLVYRICAKDGCRDVHVPASHLAVWTERPN